MNGKESRYRVGNPEVDVSELEAKGFLRPDGFLIAQAISWFKQNLSNFNSDNYELKKETFGMMRKLKEDMEELCGAEMDKQPSASEVKFKGILTPSKKPSTLSALALESISIIELAFNKYHQGDISARSFVEALDRVKTRWIGISWGENPNESIPTKK